jgi:hypothetical protein
MPMATRVPTALDLSSDSANPRPRGSLSRRRSADVCDEMRMFDAGGTREQPPTHRGSGRVLQTSQQSDSASQESDVPVRRIVRRARGDSLAEDPSACWMPLSSALAMKDQTDLHA